MYEESLRMPFLVRWPGRIAAGTEVEALTQNIDFAPTFLELAGVAVPDEMHGESLVSLLGGETPADWRDAIYYHYYESHAVHEVAAHYGVRTERYQLLHYYEPEYDYWEKFDQLEDPDELTNIANVPAAMEIRGQLERKLHELRVRYDDTTGYVGGGAFEITAGVASAEPHGDGWRIRANTSGTYLLNPCDALDGRTRFECTVRPADGSTDGNGMLIVTSGDPRQLLLRGGVDFTAGKLVLIRGMTEIASAPFASDRGAVTIAVDVDFDAGTIRAAAGGERVEGPLPKAWAGITAYGYGLSDTTTDFSPIVLTR
jgi:hypothetical protein